MTMSELQACLENCAAFEEANRVARLEATALDGDSKCNFVASLLEKVGARSVMDLAAASTDGEFLLQLRDHPHWHRAVGVVSSEVEARDLIGRMTTDFKIPARRRLRSSVLNVDVVCWDPISNAGSAPLYRPPMESVVLIDELQKHDDTAMWSTIPDVLFNVLAPTFVVVTTPNKGEHL